MLKVQEKSKPETAIWLSKQETFFSNTGDADLFFATADEEICKAKIQTINNNIYLADLSFNYPITLNQQIVAPGSKVKLQHGDSFSLGLTRFELIDPKQVLSGFAATEETSKVFFKPDQDNTDHKVLERQWVTKPTSIGNRANDSLDVILAEHRRKKRQLSIAFTLTGLVLTAGLIYFLA